MRRSTEGPEDDGMGPVKHAQEELATEDPGKCIVCIIWARPIKNLQTVVANPDLFWKIRKRIGCSLHFHLAPTSRTGTVRPVPRRDPSAVNLQGPTEWMRVGHAAGDRSPSVVCPIVSVVTYIRAPGGRAFPLRGSGIRVVYLQTRPSAAKFSVQAGAGTGGSQTHSAWNSGLFQVHGITGAFNEGKGEPSQIGISGRAIESVSMNGFEREKFG
jgi:hypothetical protein